MKAKKLTWKHYVAVAVVLVFVIYCLLAAYNSRGFVQGTKINGINVSGKTVDQVTAIFQKKADNYTLTLKERKNQKEVIGSKEIRVKFEGADDIKKIKDGQSALLWIKGLFGAEKYDNVTMFSYDRQSFNKVYKNLKCFDKRNIIKRADARPVYKDGKYVIQKEEEGTEINNNRMLQQVTEKIKSGISTLDLDKAGCYYNPKYTSNSKEIKDLAKKMNGILKGSITYKFGKQKVVLDKDVYYKWLKIGKDGKSYFVDENAMENWVLKFIYKYNTQYGWHKFKTHDGRIKKIYGGPYGWRISKDKEYASVKKMLKEGTTETRQPYWRQKGKVYDGINGDIGDTYVEVDMGAQTVYYYKKGKLKYSTSCVTGMMTAGRKTPECVAYILYKEPKATLNGQGYSSEVQYWMPFIGNVGFHSAPWRSSFGGSEYVSGGSHGCVNLPVSSAATLYKLVSQGDPVVTYY